MEGSSWNEQLESRDVDAIILPRGHGLTDVTGYLFPTLSLPVFLSKEMSS